MAEKLKPDTECILFWTSPTTAYFLGDVEGRNYSDIRYLKTSTSMAGLVYEEWCSKEDYDQIKPFC